MHNIKSILSVKYMSVPQTNLPIPTMRFAGRNKNILTTVCNFIVFCCSAIIQSAQKTPDGFLNGITF
jgi:hypothetical protein